MILSLTAVLQIICCGKIVLAEKRKGKKYLILQYHRPIVQ